MDFDFVDAHDLDSMAGRAQDENYVKSYLRERMKKSGAVVVLVGEKTKNLYRYVRWELELALDLQLAIIVVNLNNKTGIDVERCPAILRDKCAVHVPFKLAAIKKARDEFPNEFRGFNAEAKAAEPRYYNDAAWYKSMGL